MKKISLKLKQSDITWKGSVFNSCLFVCLFCFCFCFCLLYSVRDQKSASWEAWEWGYLVLFTRPSYCLSGDNFIPGTDCHLIIITKMLILAEGATIYGIPSIWPTNSTVLQLLSTSPTNRICSKSNKIFAHAQKVSHSVSVGQKEGGSLFNPTVPPYLRTGYALEPGNVFVWAVFSWHPRSPAKKKVQFCLWPLHQ